MQSLNPELLAALQVTTGLNSLEKDIENLEAFLGHANGCGLESLDSVSGKLIESGLAARYPDYFEIGSGLEGISNLLTNLKTAVTKLKGAFKGKKAEEIVAKPTTDALKALDSRYTNGFWGKWVSTPVPQVKVTGLPALVEAGPFVDVKAQVESFLTAREAELQRGVNALLAYWQGILPTFLKLRDATEEQEVLDLLATIKKYSETTRLEYDPDYVFPKAPSGGVLPTLSKEEAEQAIEFAKALVQRSKDIYKILDPVFEIGIKDDDADAYLDNASKFPSAPVRYTDKIMALVVLTDNINYFAENIRDYMFKIVNGLEDWIESSKQ
ncbi:hypothetical protein ACSA002_1810 [Salmonella phage vB_SalM_SA002]|nr:hypothetical protein ACSA002_1810 [Salmonella phage vB_SalM_SA002]